MKGNGPECANCGARGVPLFACAQCGLISYCDRVCQAQHWRQLPGGHKRFCVPRSCRNVGDTESRKPNSKPKVVNGAEEECSICLEPLSRGVVCLLPCKHAFHSDCVRELRAVGIAQACPMCRAELPPGPERLLEEGCRRYIVVERRVSRGEASWVSLGHTDALEMDQVVELWRMAADQGSAGAQNNLGDSPPLYSLIMIDSLYRKHQSILSL